MFKYNLVWMPPDAVRRSAVLNQTILRELVSSPPFEALKQRTLLEEDKAAIAALALAEQVIEMVRSERLINRREMLDLWDLKHQEEDLKERADALRAITEQPPSQGEDGEAADPELAAKIEELKQAASRAAQVSEAKVNQKVALARGHHQAGPPKRAQAPAAKGRATGPGDRPDRRGRARLQPGIRAGGPPVRR